MTVAIGKEGATQVRLQALLPGLCRVRGIGLRRVEGGHA